MTERADSTTPFPQQRSHGSGMIRPAPRQVEQVVTDIIEPRTLRRATLTVPAPRQVGQVSG